MTQRARGDETEFVQTIKLINSRYVSDIRKFKTDKIEATLKNRRRMKTTKKGLAIGRNQLFALRDANGTVTDKMEEVLRVAENFYTETYNEEGGQGKDAANSDVPSVTEDEVKKALKGMRRGRSGGEDDLAIDLIKEESEFIRG